MKPYAADRVVMETFVGREQELSHLRSNVTGGRSCIVSAGRRTGKTMLLRALVDGLLEAGIAAIYVDVQAFQGPSAAADLLRHVMVRSSQVARPKIQAETLEHAAIAVVETGRKWCLVIDEVEILARSADGTALLDNLRYVVSNSPVAGEASVVIGGGLELVLRLRSSGSSLTNVCYPVEMRPLTEFDLESLVSLQVPEPERKRVSRYLRSEAGGHPYIVQALLESMPDRVPSEIVPSMASARAEIIGRLAPQIGRN